MTFIIDPMDLTVGWCPIKCATLCKGIVYPMYGVPPGPVPL
jgi:hypothetical protein